MDRSEQKGRDKIFRQSLGKFFIDLSKLVLLGVVVGGAVQLTQTKDFVLLPIMATIGIFVSFVFAIVGFLILK